MTFDGHADRIVICQQDGDVWVAKALCEGTAPQPLICFPTFDDAQLWLERDAPAWARRASTLNAPQGLP